MAILKKIEEEFPNLKLTEDAAFKIGEDISKDAVAMGHAELFMADTKYQGFDPSVTVAVMKSRESDQDTLSVDVACLIMLFLNRGTSIVTAKKMKKMKQAGRDKVMALVQKYDILSQVPKTGALAEYDPYIITLSRVAAAFPSITFQTMITHGNVITRPVSTTQMASSGFPDFPASAMCSCIFSLIPSTGSYTALIKACLHYHVLESKIINKKTNAKDKSNEDFLAETLTYVFAAFNSKLVSETKISLKMSIKLELEIGTC